ncbi:hypothetical protein C7M84_008447 [Penaeus vannamei]|uniref:C2H2-type domain-containing protein n=1 Tax=Penaeus vannamei TaxID=6689 RepID=A0A423T9J6_PENVA|nr:hypothetical protein C7M84_008447 [Penaeus vannamei]
MEEATEMMRSFSDCAYQIHMKDAFQRATQRLFGEAFTITLNMQDRMQFYCTVCNKEMNCVNSVTEHTHSGAHQKYKLLTSSTQAVGLQMVEEFRVNSASKTYFKCNLCGAHGRMDSMYYHLIGVKHTEKYIRRRVNIEESVLHSKTREEKQQGKHMFPNEWIAVSQPRGNEVIKVFDGYPGRESQDGKDNNKCDKLEKVDSKDRACQTRCENPLDNIMIILSTYHNMMLDDNFALSGPDQVLSCMQMMFPLAETVYEVTTENMKRQTDMRLLQKQHSIKQNLNKFLGLMQHVLIPKAERDCQASSKTD